MSTHLPRATKAYPLPIALARAAALVADRFRRLVGGQEAMTDAIALAALARMPGPCRLNDLAAPTGASVSGLSRTVGRLTKHGFATRTRENVDGRAVKIALTAKGRREVEKMMAAAARCERDLTAAKGAPYVVALCRELEYVADALSAA